MSTDTTINFGDFPEYFYTILNPDVDTESISIEDAAMILAENAGIKIRVNIPGEPIRYSTDTDSSETLAVFRVIAENLPSQFLQKQSAETDSGFVSPLQMLNVSKLITKLHDAQIGPNWSNIQKKYNLPNLESLLIESVKGEQEKIKASYVGSEASKLKLLEQYKANDTWFNFEGAMSVQSRQTPNDTVTNATAATSPIDDLPSAPMEGETTPSTIPPTTDSPTSNVVLGTGTTNPEAIDFWGSIGGGGLFDEQKWLQENTGSTLKDLAQTGEGVVDQVFDISGLPSSFKSDPLRGTEYTDSTKLNISAALRYPYQLDKQGIMDLQDNLRRAGWYDRVGQSFKQHGVLDPATETAYQTFMADSVRAGIAPAVMLQDGLTNYVRNRAAESGVVYRDDVALHQTIRQMGETLIGRGLSTQETDSLIQQIRKWEQTAALGQTFAQDNYQIDIDAKTQNAIETQFKSQFLSKSVNEGLRKAGKP
jgi:hypothetical protein